MQIFVTSPSPMRCAQVLDDKRVVKMCLETCQIMSTAMYLNGYKGPYKSTHRNHPCVKWAAESADNFAWLYVHWVWLLAEYTRRYDRRHACEQFYDTFNWYINELRDGVYIETVPEFVNCTPYKDKDVFMAYQLYLGDKWEADRRPPTWNKVGR